MLTFGLSTKFWSVVFGRALAGFLDGNIGVIKTVFGELTDDSNRALAFSFFPTTWILGSTIGKVDS
jgi:MFS family permease